MNEAQADQIAKHGAAHIAAQIAAQTIREAGGRMVTEDAQARILQAERIAAEALQIASGEAQRDEALRAFGGDPDAWSRHEADADRGRAARSAGWEAVSAEAQKRAMAATDALADAEADAGRLEDERDAARMAEAIRARTQRFYFDAFTAAAG